jgi:hypothetical protein
MEIKFESEIGDIFITDISMVATSSRGRYNVNVDYLFNGNGNRITFTNFDSELYEIAKNKPNRAEILYENLRNTVQLALEAHVYSID